MKEVEDGSRSGVPPVSGILDTADAHVVYGSDPIGYTGVAQPRDAMRVSPLVGGGEQVL